MLREAKDRADKPPKAPKQRIRDHAELQEYQYRKRKEFEDSIRMNRYNFGTWIRYAQWEETQEEFARARSCMERALQLDQRNQSLWMRYAELEMKNKFVNHARNVFDRAVTMLPRVDQFWFKYAYMEEMLGNIAGARQIFERWMQWEPSEHAWNLYIKLEKRYKEYTRVRAIFYRYVRIHPDTKIWLKWAKFEEEIGEIENARNVFSQCLDALGTDHLNEHILIGFARFETRLKEFERARAIYKYAQDTLQEEKVQTLYSQFAQFEKQFGQRQEIEDVITRKRRAQYENEIAENSTDYDAWFDYIRLEESLVNIESSVGADKCRDVYERAIAQVPPVKEKKYWRRYIYLWINYAIFEELTMKDMERARQVYKKCLEIIPHKVFTFAKCWILYAKFELRNLNLDVARKYMGIAIGLAPKDKLYKGYVEQELHLREFDRCRILYEGFLKFSPTNSYPWTKYAELESLLEETERTRALYELAIQQPLDMPEVVWKAYIDFEFEFGNWSRVRSLYTRLLDRTGHPKVWTSNAVFELHAPELDIQDRDERLDDDDDSTDELSKITEDSVIRARSVFQEGHRVLKEREMKTERKMLLEAWIDFEMKNVEQAGLSEVESVVESLKGKLPTQVKKRRKLYPDDREDSSMEEFLDFVFPEDEEEERKRRGGGVGVSKLLAMAKQWKETQEA